MLAWGSVHLIYSDTVGRALHKNPSSFGTKLLATLPLKCIFSETQSPSLKNIHIRILLPVQSSNYLFKAGLTCVTACIGCLWKEKLLCHCVVSVHLKNLREIFHMYVIRSSLKSPRHSGKNSHISQVLLSGADNCIIKDAKLCENLM